MLQVSQLPARLNRVYEDKLAEIVLCNLVYPLRFDRIGTPTSVSDLEAWRQWVEELSADSKVTLGFGYEVIYEERSYGRKGVQRVPVALQFTGEEDFLAKVGKQREVKAIRVDLVLIDKQIPHLGEWARKNIGFVRQHHGNWPKLLEVVSFLRGNPRPGIYRREVPIAVPDKFIEQNQAALRELLDFALPAEAIGPSDDFGERFGFKSSAQLVRVRLPQDMRPAGFWASDVAMPLAEWGDAAIAPKRVLVVENITTYLAIPFAAGVPIIMGSGWSARRLDSIPWVKLAEVFYWGDLDVPGFEILAALRKNHGNVRSVMMDTDVLTRFGELAVPHQARADNDIEHQLTAQEAAAWRLVKESRWQLAQEKLPFPFILAKLEAALSNV